MADNRTNPKRSEDTSSVQATPRNKVLGAVADAFDSLHNNYLRKQFGFTNEATEAISEFMGIPAFANMMDRLSYGESPFKGKGQTTQLKPWAVNGLSSLPAGAATNTGLKAIKALPKAIEHAAPYAARHAVKAVEKYGVSPTMNVVRPRGSQTVEQRLAPELDRMKYHTHGAEDPATKIKQMEEAFATSRAASPEYQAAYDREMENLRPLAAVNQWVEGPLKKYIKRDMGTPEDPLRKLADEEGILHYDFSSLNETPDVYTRHMRKQLGYPPEGMAQTPLGKRFEYAADVAVDTPTQAGSPMASSELFQGKEPPQWFKDLPPETNVFDPDVYNMQFDILPDTLVEFMRRGRLRPENLSKVSVTDAARMAHELEQMKLKEDMERMAKNFPIHRKYDSGFHWVELKANPATSVDELHPEALNRYERAKSIGNVSDEEALQMADPYHREYSTADALTREGELMSHCVGGYCDPVMEGHTRIFSLRDSSGKPHVTVEANKPTADDVYDQVYDDLESRLERAPTGDEIDQAIEDYLAHSQWSISQIKGKGNMAPIENYQPYVADLVRGDELGRIEGDLHNTDMVRIGNRYIRRSELEDLSKQQNYPVDEDPNSAVEWFQRASKLNPEFLSEADKSMLEAINNFVPPVPKKKGGVVKFADGGLATLRQTYFGNR